MSSPIQIENVSTDQVTYVEISGSIDGHLDPQSILDVLTTKKVVFNLAKIDEITDDGKPRWQELLAAITKNAEQLVFVECAPVVVEQLNREPRFFGDHELASACVTLECEVCLRKTVVAIDLDQPVTAETLLFSCAQCDSPLAPEVEPAEYFAFADEVAVTSLSAEMQEAMIAFGNRHARASIEPGSEEAEEMRAVAEAIAADVQETPAHRTSRTSRSEDATQVAPAHTPPTASSPSIAVTNPTPTAFPAGASRREKNRTDPAIVVGQDRRAASAVRTSPRIDTSAAQRRRPRTLLPTVFENTATIVASGIAVAAVLMLVVVLALGRPAGVPPQLLLSFMELLRNEQFAQAEQLLSEHSNAASPELLEMARSAINGQRANLAKRARQEAIDAYAQKDFDDALRHATTVLAIEAADLEALFVAGESLRQREKLVEAGEFYEKFIEQAGDDPRLDDTLFWFAESLVKQDKLAAARKIYARLAIMDASNFKTSAQRRLAELTLATE